MRPSQSPPRGLRKPSRGWLGGMIAQAVEVVERGAGLPVSPRRSRRAWRSTSVAQYRLQHLGCSASMLPQSL
eukprot:4935070-Pyramimonas_sp.AAC.1